MTPSTPPFRIRRVLLAAALAFAAVLSPSAPLRAQDQPAPETAAQEAAGEEDASLAALAPRTDIASVAAGSGHTCALTTAGGVLCWGENSWGQLGDGTRTASALPVAVTGLRAEPSGERLSAGFTGLAAGSGHTCALSVAGGVKCWGNNMQGQTGDGSGEAMRLAPVAVAGLTSGVAAIAAGSQHTCALTTGGGVKCWGDNGAGQLGNGATTNSSTPVDVTGLHTGVAAVRAGSQHTCALTIGGEVRCWGDNAYGQLGDGTATDRLAPTAVPGLTGVQAIAAGALHTCALTAGGGVKCWGLNQSGQIGDGGGGAKCGPVWNQVDCRLAPANVSGLASGVVAISASGSAREPLISHSCALTSAGGVKCWGDNYYGQLGDATRTPRFTPVEVHNLSAGVHTLSAGGRHTCAVTTQGIAKCWGDNLWGQLGDGRTYARPTPATVIGLSSGARAVSAGLTHTCALSTGVNAAGGALCWGNNSDDPNFGGAGQLGTGATTDASTPAAVATLAAGVQAVAAGEMHSCALTTGGAVLCWGHNLWGEVGDGSTATRLSPVATTGLGSGVQALAAGGQHACALTTGGGVKCWGDNDDGQLGDGGGGSVCGPLFLSSSVCRLTPVNVSSLSSGVQAISAGDSHTCALTDAGGVKCWGANGSGQLGDGTTAGHATPVDVAGLGPAQAVAAGGAHTCALTDAGAVKCWGSNFFGQLGDGSAANRSAPAVVAGLASGVRAVAAGYFHTCALTTSGGVKCWGENNFGQLGDGTSGNTRPTPVDVVGLQSGVRAIAAGGEHTCALSTGLTDAGAVKCWGSSVWGQLGTKTLWTPVDVVSAGGAAAWLTLRGAEVFFPGSVETYAVTVRNPIQATVQDAVLRVSLPAAAEYVDSTQGGIHWWAQREVYWRLGALAPGQEKQVTLRVLYDWGVTAGIDDSLSAQLGGSNLAASPFDVAPYLAHVPLQQTAAADLTADQVAALRAAHPELASLYNTATAQGYAFAYASRHTFSSAPSGPPELVRIVLLRSALGKPPLQPRFGVAFLWLQDGRAVLTTAAGAGLDLETAQGAMRYDPWTKSWSGSPLSSAAAGISRWDCMKNCVWEKVPNLAFSKLSKTVETVSTAISCVKAVAGDSDAALDCAKLVGKVAPAVDIGVDLGVELGRCNADCKECKGSCTQAECHCCTRTREYCEYNDWLFGLIKRHAFNRSICNLETGRYSLLAETFWTCPFRECCVMAGGRPECVPCNPTPLSASLSLAPQDVGLEAQPAGGPSSQLCPTSRTAKDPNALYGPQGDLLPGQRVAYRITYENIGAAPAHGVFVVDALGQHFDPATVQMDSPIAYDLVGGTLFWYIGDLAPKGQPGAQGEIKFSVRLRDGLPAGTVIDNQAAVHFPSVPEVTPTNAVLNAIRPLVALPQTVQARAGQGIAFTLRGADAGGASLTFRIVEPPRSGALSGSAPNLTYTPAADFSGGDRLFFTVNNGSASSRVAAVTFQVAPSEDDSTAPRVLWSSPAGGEVLALATNQSVSGPGGSYYPPALSVRFSEPVDPATVSADTVRLSLQGGSALSASVYYVAPLRQAYLYPQTPWRPGGRYTLAVTPGVHDLNHNALSAAYRADFSVAAASHTLFLPSILAP